jgi:hypothetical protein
MEKENIQVLEDSLRAAVVAGLFPDIQRLLNRYVGEVERRLREDALGTPEVRALAEQTHRLLEWTGNMLMTLREESGAELARLGFVHSYDPGEDQPQQVLTQA